MHLYLPRCSAVALAVAALTGCDGVQPVPSDSTPSTTECCSSPPCDCDCTTTYGSTGDFYEGPTLIDYVEAVCSSTDIVINADTVGRTSAATLNLTDSANAAPLDEEHPLESAIPSANCFWDLVEATLSEGAAVGEWTPGVSSMFTCDAHIRSGVMTYAIRVYDLDGMFADCATWGDDPEGYISGAYADGANPVSSPSELASCIVF